MLASISTSNERPGYNAFAKRKFNVNRYLEKPWSNEMKTHSLHKEQFIARPLAEVFAFFARPENLARITPPSMDFRIVSVLPMEMREGAVFEYSIRVMGIRMRWRSLISEYKPPFRFVDEQLSGPYAYWNHTHAFREVAGGTVITDTVRYRMPLSVIGNLVQMFAVRRQLENIFGYRSQVIEKVFEKKVVDSPG